MGVYDLNSVFFDDPEKIKHESTISPPLQGHRLNTHVMFLSVFLQIAIRRYRQDHRMAPPSHSYSFGENPELLPSKPS